MNTFPAGPASAADRSSRLTNALKGVADDIGVVAEIKSWPDHRFTSETLNNNTEYRHAASPDDDLFFDSFPQKIHTVTTAFARGYVAQSVFKIAPALQKGSWKYMVSMDTPTHIKHSMIATLVIDSADFLDLSASIKASSGFVEFQAQAIAQVRIGFICSFLTLVDCNLRPDHKGAMFRYVEKDTKGTWTLFGRKYYDQDKYIYVEFTPSCFASALLDASSKFLTYTGTPRTFATAADFADWAAANRPPIGAALLQAVDRIICAL